MEYQKKSYQVDTGGLRGELPLTDFQKQQIEEYISSLSGKKNINICLSDSVKLSDIQPISQLLLLSEINVA